MRVTFLGQNSPDTFSGGRYHAWMMAEAAAFMGHEVRFVTDYKPYFYDDFTAYPAHRHVQIDRAPVLKQGGWDIPDYDCDVLVVVPHGAWTPYFYLRARLFAARHRARLVMINFETPNWFNSLAPVPRDPSAWNGWKLCSEGASMVLSISREGTKYAKDFYTTCPKHTLFTECHPGINSIVADSVMGETRQKRIVFLGRLEKGEHKGLLTAADFLCESMRGYTLVLISGIGEASPEFLQDLEARAAQYGVKVEFLYKISDEEKFRQLKKASLMLFPSQFEGFGIPPVESQYCGVPCVAYDLPVLREVSAEGMAYVSRGDVAAFKERIGHVLGSEVNGTTLKSGIAPVARFEHFSARLDRVLHEAIQRGEVAKERRLRSVGERIGLQARMLSLLPRRAAGSARSSLARAGGSAGSKSKGNGHGAVARRSQGVKGRLFWFAQEKGFGFVRPETGEDLLFVHHSFVADPDRFSFKLGAQVEYEPVQGLKGLEARGLRLQEKYGFSRCELDEPGSAIRAGGWFLGRELEKVDAYVDGYYLGSGRTGVRRPDVLENFPEYKTLDSGWLLDCPLNRLLKEHSVLEVHVFPRGGDCRVLRKPIGALKGESDATRALRRLPNKHVVGKKPQVDNEAILERFRDFEISVDRHKVDFERYDNWCKEVDYPRNYDKYVKEFPLGDLLQQKMLQHFLSIDLMGLRGGQVYMDVASSNSVFPKIVLANVGVEKAYRQDLKYKPGVHGDFVGGDAADIPLPDASIDAMALHCSWEHFEGDSDTRLLQEAGRLLRPGGRICIVPLYMANEFLIQTSPGKWKRGKELDVPAFDEAATLYLQEEIHQRCMRSHDVDSLMKKVFQATPENLNLRIHYFENWRERRGCPVFALTGRKTAEA